MPNYSLVRWWFSWRPGSAMAVPAPQPRRQLGAQTASCMHMALALSIPTPCAVSRACRNIECLALGIWDKTERQDKEERWKQKSFL